MEQIDPGVHAYEENPSSMQAKGKSYSDGCTDADVCFSSVLSDRQYATCMVECTPDEISCCYGMSLESEQPAVFRI